MALKARFFNSTNQDRTYTAEDMAEYFASLVGNGVFAGVGSSCKVVASSGMGVNVQPGKLWINGYFAVNTADFSITVAPSDSTFPRIDCIVARIDLTQRTIVLAAVTGSPAASPTAPALVRTDTIYELGFATILIMPNATSITQSNITDTRADSNVCGWVTGIIEQIDATELFTQFQAQFNGWFENLQNQLDENQAGNLQNQIDTINTDLQECAKTSYVDTSVQAISSQVKGFYATVAALTAALPSGNDYSYVVTADGYIYRWNGSWASTGYSYNAVNLADNSVTFAKANKTDIQTTRYPFQNAATLKNASNVDISDLLRSAFVDIRLYGASETEQYAIGRITVTDTETQITIWNAAYTIVCAYYYAGRRLPLKETITLSPMNNSGITAKIIINWAAFSSSVSYQYLSLVYSYTGISKQCYVDNIRQIEDKQTADSLQEQIDFIDGYSKFPFSKRALLYRRAYNDGQIDKNAFVSIVIGTKIASARYYVSEFTNKTTSRRLIILSEEIGGKYEEIFFSADNSGTRYSGIEYIQLTCGSEIRGYALINWNYATAYNLYQLADTELDFACCVPFEVFRNNMLIDVPELVLPDVMYATVGHEFNIYFESVLRCKNPENFHWKITLGDGNIGHQYSDRLSFIPTSSDLGDKTLSVSVYYDSTTDAAPVITKTVTVKVLASGALSQAKNVMFIGDSYTDMGYIISEIKNMAGENLNFVGTRTSTQIDANGNSRTLSHEGRSGWTTTNYMQASRNSVVNPFYNSAVSTFDFSYYMATQSVQKPDIVNICLGTNDGYNWKHTQAPLAVIVNSIKAYDSSIKIVVTTLSPTPKDAYGYGRSNLTNGDWNWKQQQYMLSHVQGIYADYGDREDENIFIAPAYKNIDRDYDYEKAVQAVSTRNPATKSVTWDNVHVSRYGFYKISDEWYSVLQRLVQ